MSVHRKIKTSPATPAYYSCEHAHSRHKSSTSHFWHLLEARAAKKNDPWCLPVILIWANLIFMKIHILMKFWHSYVSQCSLLFQFKKWSPASGSKTGSSGVSTSIWENYWEVFWIFKLFEFFNMVVNSDKMSGWAKIKTSPATPAYYSYEHAHSKHISSTSHE